MPRAHKVANVTTESFFVVRVVFQKHCGRQKVFDPALPGGSGSFKPKTKAETETLTDENDAWQISA